MKTKNTLCIAEWQSFSIDEIKEVCDSQEKAQKIFSEFVEFAQQDGNHYFLKFKNSKTLVAQNYVGIIQTTSGFCLEILPKTFRTKKNSEGFNAYNEQSQENEIKKAKEILLKMLKSLKNAPFKESDFANLKAQNFPLLEIFILMFLEELLKLIKRGMKANYITKEENRSFLKGKLLFNENLKSNFAHKERFFTSSDEFSVNIAPNRIIKSTLEFLSKQNLSAATSTKLNQMRFIFSEIDPSQNITKDLSQCHNTRTFKHYSILLQWCEIFLRYKTFTLYKGDSKAFALLFDMNKVFEDFVASEMKKWCNNTHFQEKNPHYKEFIENIDLMADLHIKTQEKSKYLAQNQKEKDIFQLKPDIVAYQDSKPHFIADTKWKMLDTQERNFAISQSDMYQIFAYLAKYKCTKGFLIYPKIEEMQNKELSLQFEFKPQIAIEDSKNNSTLTILFFPLNQD
ncbi:restriction endonuclease [Helicobacter sp. MIT 11-5569]|uniref:McrC family protein n=1 Tax=Helicobacter sp. MIT 11-5569 TaxID=1548151 RepID=UPI00051FBE24|nr:McrC family protein [Helicobacter sp. MIT 11-5569]TLD82713.1 restriction endonuclease [Helicobacter sp. MIT 11-5569]